MKITQTNCIKFSRKFFWWKFIKVLKIPEFYVFNLNCFSSPIDELIKSRESAYTEYIQSSSEKYRNYDSQVENTASAQSSGLLGSLGKMFTGGKKWNGFFYIHNYLLIQWIEKNIIEIFRPLLSCFVPQTYLQACVSK